LPVIYLREQFLRQLRGWPIPVLANHLFSPDAAEGIAESILGFDYTVSVEEEASSSWSSLGAEPASGSPAGAMRANFNRAVQCFGSEGHNVT
jgi:hypothetical protein